MTNLLTYSFNLLTFNMNNIVKKTLIILLLKVALNLLIILLIKVHTKYLIIISKII